MLYACSQPSVVRTANVMRIVASGYCMRRIAFPHAPVSSRFAMLSEAVPWMRTHIDVRAVPCLAEPRLVVIIGNHNRSPQAHDERGLGNISLVVLDRADNVIYSYAAIGRSRAFHIQYEARPHTYAHMLIQACTCFKCRHI